MPVAALGSEPGATAVGLGADRFITNSQRDSPAAITEISITYPADLPDPLTEPGNHADAHTADN